MHGLVQKSMSRFMCDSSLQSDGLAADRRLRLVEGAGEGEWAALNGLT